MLFLFVNCNSEFIKEIYLRTVFARRNGTNRMKKREILKLSFIKSLPILFSYLFIGAAYGILMQQAGFPWLSVLLVSMCVYTGAFQFVLTTLMASGASLLTIAVTAFFMNSRQTFYALTFLDDISKTGRRKLFMIHSLTDETYAVNCTLDLPPEEKREVMFHVAAFSYVYWIVGSLLGAVVGQLLPFSTDGIDFCMTALFVTIFLDQWEKSDRHFPALLGLTVGIVCLLIFGERRFMLPALLLVSAALVYDNSRSTKEAEKS